VFVVVYAAAADADADVDVEKFFVDKYTLRTRVGSRRRSMQSTAAGSPSRLRAWRAWSV
jgi:hypothetical protein